MLGKWFIIFCAVVGAWYVLPGWFPMLSHVALETDMLRIKYVHIVILIILGCGWKLESD
jgi:hypothetical protein